MDCLYRGHSTIRGISPTKLVQRSRGHDGRATIWQELNLTELQFEGVDSLLICHCHYLLICFCSICWNKDCNKLRHSAGTFRAWPCWIWSMEVMTINHTAGCGLEFNFYHGVLSRRPKVCQPLSISLLHSKPKLSIFCELSKISQLFLKLYKSRGYSHRSDGDVRTRPPE